ncbi:MAG: transposase [Candidatus Gorgyraea atricola]|nr:transposase [Candidatus Gorgyraea atricola]
MRKVKFVEEGVYHIYNRGTDKRKVFCEDRDYLRFIHSMSGFNTTKPVELASILRRRNLRKNGGFASALVSASEKLVKILYFVLMPNHYHLVLQQMVAGGVEKFMQKLGTGYAMYFNKKYKRNGVLFQGVFKANSIETESYIMQISKYIHRNPLKLIEPQFREKGVRDLERAKLFLRNYRWSSYLDFLGMKKYPFLIDNELHGGYFRNSAEYEDFVLSGPDVDVVEAKPPQKKTAEVSPRPAEGEVDQGRSF